MRVFNKYIYVLFLLLVSAVVSAQEASETVTARLVVPEVEVHPGDESCLYVDLENPDKPYVSVQFDLYMPQPFTVTKVSRVTTRIPYEEDEDGITYAIDLQYTHRADGATRILLVPNSALGSRPFTGTSGSILKINVKVAPDVTPGQYDVELKNIRLTGVNAKTDYLADCTYAVTVKKQEVVFYRLTYLIDGKVFKTMNVRGGASVTHPSVPTREGYTFSGWDKTIASMPECDETVEGSYIPNLYTVTFLNYDGTLVQRGEQTFGTPLTVPTDEVQREGHTFVGYFEDADARTGFPEATVPARDVTYQAAFDANRYTIRFLDADGTVLSSSSCLYMSRIAVPTEPSLTGHTFAGWDKTVPTSVPACDMDFTATYAVNSYRVTFVVNGMTISENMIPYGTDIIFPSVSKVGFTFSGWDRSDKTVPDHDITFTGSFIVNPNVLTFIVDGLEFYKLNLPYGAAVPQIEAPQKEGHTFVQWVGLPKSMPDFDVSVTAQYAVNRYTASFYDEDGETLIQRYELDFGQAIPVPEAPCHEGYSFASYGEVDATMAGHDVRYVARYTVHVHHLTAQDENGDTWMEADVPYGAPIADVFTQKPDRAGYDFVCWKDAPATMPDRSLVLVPLFERTTYTIDGIIYMPGLNEDETTLTGNVSVVGMVNGFASADVAIQQKRAMYAEQRTEACHAILPSHVTPQNGGRTFTVTAIASAAFENSPITSLTIPETVSQIEPSAVKGCDNLKTIAFLGTDVPQMGVGAIELTDATQIFLPSDATDDFIDAIANQQDGDASTEVNVTKADVLSDYCVTITSADGSPLDDQTHYSFGDNVVLTAPERVGYDVVWTDRTADMVSYANPYVFTAVKDAEVEWQYKVRSYSIRILVDGKTYVDGRYPYGADLPTITIPAKDGYRLIGWESLPASMPACDIMFEARFVLVGDVTGDGRVSVKDITTLVDHLRGYRNEVFDPVAADVDNDGKIDAEDVRKLSRAIIR